MNWIFALLWIIAGGVLFSGQIGLPNEAMWGLGCYILAAAYIIRDR